MQPTASRLGSSRIVSAVLVRIAAVALVIVVAACASRGRAPIEERSPRAAPPAVTPAPASETPQPPEAESRPQTYIVKQGDTLRAIASDHGVDYRELAALNNIENPNKIVPGQVLRIVPTGTAPGASTGVQTMPLRSAPAVQSGEAASALASAAAAAAGGRNTETYKTQPKAIKEPYSEQALRDVQRAAGIASPVPTVPGDVAAPPAVAMAAEAKTLEPKAAEPKAAEPKSVPKSSISPPDDGGKLDWAWPAKGKVVTQFSDSTTFKGIDIAGSAGQPVTASAGGKVVYAGSGLRGYGKLIIIKHNDAYLSAYAHNRDILVKEGQQVVKGQKIAEMGNTDTDQVKLHFEIRRQGKPVDPLRYLPPA
jgi:lipoprotein NlpD